MVTKMSGKPGGGVGEGRSIQERCVPRTETILVPKKWCLCDPYQLSVAVMSNLPKYSILFLIEHAGQHQ